ncbi:DUF2262 domain-containing protein [Planctomicrobium piriforme]|uniref:DUF2262 domain-containing protein n=1 Tax=Planctomicrobium piriforme TaxID=1576369 RepID=A0A1I3BHD4_9PLAN|nr:DUF2262 domain-containing protein [Planctomicrobium piriforme]SFH61715.1 hypothetical protein SAMN05421753_101456 [Planctomicrobium piriforme]
MPKLPASFSPPSLKSLSDLDSAEGVVYQQQRVIIDGVVSPTCQGGLRGKTQDYEVHSFTVAAWLKAGEQVRKTELDILRAAASNTKYLYDFPGCSLQRMSVLMSGDETRAIYEKSLPMETANPDLLAIAEELKKPVTVVAGRFGTLTLDRRIDHFDGEAIWNGEKTKVTFRSKDGKPDQAAIENSEKLWSNEFHWEKRIKVIAVEDLLELKNENWSDEDDPEFTAEEFVKRMTLQTICVQNDGRFEFWYDDGDLFSGHSIVVRGSLEKGIRDASIQG